MKKDTIIDPQWEEEERRREAEREARRHPKRYARRQRALAESEGIYVESDTIAPWDDPQDIRPRRDARYDEDDEPREVWLGREPELPAGYDYDEPRRPSRGEAHVAADSLPVAEETRPVAPAAEDDDIPERRPSKLKEYIGSLLSGNILSRGEVRRLYPYLLFVAFLMLLYISNVFRMQQLHRREEALTRQVKELRAKSLTVSSLRMNSTRQSEIIQELHRRGIDLEESLEPPKVIK